MDSTGIIKVFLLQSGKFAFRLKFQFAVEPAWAISKANSISPGAAIGMESESLNPDIGVANQLSSSPVSTGQPEGAAAGAEGDGQHAQEGELEEAINELDALALAERDGQAQHVEPSESYTYEADEADLPELVEDDEEEGGGEGVPVTRASVKNSVRLEKEREAEKYAEYVAMGWQEPELEDRDRVVFGRNNGQQCKSFDQRKHWTQRSRHGITQRRDKASGGIVTVIPWGSRILGMRRWLSRIVKDACQTLSLKATLRVDTAR
jgi:hypothetical protein